MRERKQAVCGITMDLIEERLFPEGTRIYGVEHDLQRDRALFYVEHDDFPPLLEGAQIPEVFVNEISESRIIDVYRSWE